MLSVTTRWSVAAAFILAAVAVIVGLTVLGIERPRRSVPHPPGDGHGRAVEPLVPLGDRVWLSRGGGCNTVVIETATGVVVIDPKYAISWPAFSATVRAVTTRPITHVVVTHYHEDHTSAASLVGAEVRIVGHAAALDRMRDSGFLPAGLDAGHARLVAVTAPTTLFEGDDRITLLPAAPAHTDGDAFIVVPRARLLHAGDLMPDRVPPIIDVPGGGRGTSFAAALVRTADTLTGVDQVVTGHGPVVDWAEFRVFSGLLPHMVDYVSREMRTGRSKNAVFKAWTPPQAVASYDLSRSFATLDEIDRGLRPRWQRLF